MPGPGQKKTTKPRGIATSALKVASPGSDLPFKLDAFSAQVNSTEGWSNIINVLCKEFGVPDLTTRTGLKRVHTDFEAIFKRLDDAFAKYAENKKLVGGIIGIYAKMCTDWLLRNQLWGKGLLGKLLPHLDHEATRHVTLRALAAVTHHGGVDVRLEIAVHANKLLGLIEAFQDDELIAELVISALSHSLAAVFDRDFGAPAHIVTKLDMRAIYKVTTETMRKEWASSGLIYHGITLLALSTIHTSAACKAYPPTQQLLIAGLRSSDWIVRCTCLRGIIRLYHSEAEGDVRILDPNRMINRARIGFPTHLQKALDEFWPLCSNTFITTQTMSQFQEAMWQVMEDKDLCAFGLKLAEFIPRSEFSIFDGAVFDGDPRRGGRMRGESGLPFQRWSEALPHCAQALRARKDPKDEDKIYILLIKWAIMSKEVMDAVKLAHEAVQQFPDIPYFYYVISLSGDREEALKGAKKGLKIRYMTPFVKTQLLQRAVDTAGHLGMQILQDCAPLGMGRWGEGVALLTSALEDAKTCFDTAAPDNRQRNAVSYWYTLLTIVVKGPELSLDLSDLKSGLEAQKMADDFFKAVLLEPSRTDMRLTYQNVIKHYQVACKNFGNVMAKTDVRENPVVSKKELEDDLATWLEDTHLHGVYPDPDIHVMPHHLSDNSVELYRCSNCGNPSAVLRKCSRCSKARYCDAECQKEHWKAHKRACRA